MIPVTKPFLPPLATYQAYIERVWQRNWLTNNGPLVSELEMSLKEELGVDHILFMSNGTIAIQIAIKALGLSGEIITTPFSYVATTSSIVWEGCTPVFVDIDEQSLNIDPTQIEAAITERTSAILATHVYGNPCEVEAIQKIADRHGLRVIYDAAHCFGTTYDDRSVLTYGDVSTISFHATKLFHTTEGGAVVTKEPNLLQRMAYMRGFGHDGPDKYNGVGINGKNSELHAAMGLCNLPFAKEIIAKRKSDHARYDYWFSGKGLRKPVVTAKATSNCAYYPVIFPTEEQCVRVFEKLKGHQVFARRYFYPSLSELDYVKAQPVPVTTDIAARVLCLPLYYQITEEEIDLVCRLVLRFMNYG